MVILRQFVDAPEELQAVGEEGEIEVKDARHLTHIAAALRANPLIETVDRAKG